jgi:putative endonuclease
LDYRLNKVILCLWFGKKENKEPTFKQKIGKVGEDFACEYLLKNYFKIIERNYLKKWGEIDIVAGKGSKLHFIEVKSVSRQYSSIRDGLNYQSKIGNYRPEDNMHPWKLKRLGRAIQSYLLDRDVPENVDWQFDVVTVYLDQNQRLLKIEYLDDVVL